MKKKFDFSAEIESAKARTNQEYRERYEEENKLLKVNAHELMKLNDNIHEMRTVLETLVNAVPIDCKHSACLIHIISGYYIIFAELD